MGWITSLYQPYTSYGSVPTQQDVWAAQAAKSAGTGVNSLYGGLSNLGAIGLGYALDYGYARTLGERNSSVIGWTPFDASLQSRYDAHSPAERQGIETGARVSGAILGAVADFYGGGGYASPAINAAVSGSIDQLNKKFGGGPPSAPMLQQARKKIPFVEGLNPQTASDIADINTLRSQRRRYDPLITALS